MEVVATTEKPHAVCIPFPAQGHINPMLKVAMLLHSKGFHITFVNTHFNHSRLLKSRGPGSLDGLHDFRFESIPDGLPPSDADATQDVASLVFATKNNCLAPFRELLQKLDQNSSTVSGAPIVSCIICDALMTFASIAANEIGAPCVAFRTSTAYLFMLVKHMRVVMEKGLLPLKGNSTNEHLNSTVDWIPGIKSIRLKDFPSFFKSTCLSDEMITEFVVGEAERTSKTSAIIFNSFDELEPHVLHAFSSTICPPIYTIGPLQLLINKLPTTKIKYIGSNLWKEDAECLKWLDSKEPNSVIYVNYGSITVMTKEKLVEFAWGLANCKHNFLWVIRPDLVIDDTTVLPLDFFQEIKGRGLIAGWCPQEEVLDHVAVGAFLTHCGWNSMIESLACGVPMICWPFFADQPTNCKLACGDWGVGMELGEDVKRDEVEVCVRELMEGEKGKMMRKNAMEWKRKAYEATGEFGSSSLNLDKLIKEVLLWKT